MAKSETYEELTKRLLDEKAAIDRRLAAAKTAKVKKERDRDTARKILLGAFLEKMLKDEGAQGKINFIVQSKLPGFLTRQRDRDLFPEFSFVDDVDEDGLI